MGKIIPLSLLFFLILWVQQVSACVCLPSTLMERFATAEFVATAKIIKISADKENSSMHIIEVEIIDLFKGEHISSLRIGSDLFSSCSFYTSVNTTWLIFAYRDQNGNLSFGHCSGAKQIDKKFNLERYPNVDKKYKRTIDRKLAVLKYLKNKEIELSNRFGLKVYFPTKCLENFRGLEVKEEPFALFELTVDRDLSIKKVKLIKEFDNGNLTADLTACIKEAYIVNRERIAEIPKKTKIVIALYYYANSEKRKSFISLRDV